MGARPGPRPPGGGAGLCHISPGGPGPKRGAAGCQGTSRRALLGVGCHWHANGPALSNAPCQWARAEHQKATPGQCAHVYRSAQTERAEFTTGSFPVPQWLRNHLRANRERATRPHGFSRCSSASLPWARLFRTRRFAQLHAPNSCSAASERCPKESARGRLPNAHIDARRVLAMRYSPVVPDAPEWTAQWRGPAHARAELHASP